MSEREEILREELEVLESIYPDELETISATHLQLRIEPEVPVTTEPLILCFTVKYPPDYPDVLPDMTLDPEDGELADEEREELLEELRVLGEESIGMAMVFTLASHLRESLSSLVLRRVARKQAEQDEKHRIEEEAQAARLRGTAVTPASFLKWRDGFLKELKAKKEKDEEERIKSLPPREREEVKRAKGKLSGRQLFQSDRTLATSDQALAGDEDAVEVDISQYDRDGPREDEEEEEGVLLTYDSD
ncbi:RWD domain-containing protein [Mrakia frigida]|uniref:Gir2p n=1 Tax=Mrakia frigida TaxID=29902 RepID=UPI003FCC18BA